MNINQYNKNGDNIVNVYEEITTRALTEERKDQILSQLKEYNATGVVIHFEYSSETEQFVQEIVQFLKMNTFAINCVHHIMSGLPRDGFFIEPPKDNLGWA